MRTTTNINARTRVAAFVMITFLLAVSLLPMASAQSTVDLDTADSFAILAGSALTNTGPSVINGNIGVHPGTSVTGFEDATVNGEIQIADEVAEQAKVDLTDAYNDAAGRSPATSLATELGHQFLTPGVYDSEAGTFGLTGALTLDAQGDPDAAWIFQMESTLITASGSSVVLVNGAKACNVFWQVGSSATLGTGTDFKGNILAQAAISMNNGATLDGRALARTEAVTLINNVITIAECEEPSGDEFPGDCSTGLTASANGDSSITLTWNSIQGAEQYRIHRATRDGAFMLHDEINGDARNFIDTDTEVGELYRYELRPVVDGVEFDDCEVIEVAAIPFFPTLLAGALALVGSVAAYALSRRRT